MYLLRLFKENTKTVLGRWNIQYNSSIISLKVDQANEDHCGVCVTPKPELLEERKQKKIENSREKQRDEYYQAFLI